MKKEKVSVSSYKKFLYSTETQRKVVSKLFIDGLTKLTFTLLKAGKVPPEMPTEMAYSSEQVNLLKNNCILFF